MKLKMAAASLAVAALTAGPIASAAPGNGNKPVTPPGQSVSAAAKSGAGAVGVLTVLSGVGPYNTGRPTAMAHVTTNHPAP